MLDPEKLVDRAYQRFYANAYKLMKVYWAVRRPKTHGALVMIWHDGQVLLIRQSYLQYYSLPGGYVKPEEDGLTAAVRELREELSLQITREQLQPVLDIEHEWNKHLDHVEVFELDVASRPDVHIDNREVISADWYTPEQAIELDLFPPIRAAIARRLKREGRPMPQPKPKDDAA